VLPVLYLVGFQGRRLNAWSTRSAGPTDRVGFYLCVWLIAGALAGSFAQPLWDLGQECGAAGRPVVLCVLRLDR
jgi:hypothetical protein